MISARDVQVVREWPDRPSATLLDDVEADVATGEVVAVVGRRGAGVSTLLGVLGGRVRPTRGRVRVLGVDPSQDRRGLLTGSVTVLPAHGALFDHLTVAETVGLWTSLHADPHDLEDLLELADLAPFASVLVRRLDVAAQQRLRLAVTFAGRTPLVVCDEPAGGAAAGTGRALAALLGRHRAEGGTAVVAGGSPDALDPDVVARADRIAVLRRGRLVTLSPPGEVIARFAAHGAATVLLTDAREAGDLTSAVPGATFQRVGEQTRVELPDCPAGRVRQLTEPLRSVVDLRHHEATLTDAVRRATADRRRPVARTSP
ncbi:ABC transporter ATP-binding protein [Kineococcus sp. SYSU DK003]|uniref:ABC transporter ATP-binding protein n=1 Tax=Kineococcus sp. SYSU DK003 TaxID=3383124 RepID=UPI003D7ECDEB